VCLRNYSKSEVETLCIECIVGQSWIQRLRIRPDPDLDGFCISGSGMHPNPEMQDSSRSISKLDPQKLLYTWPDPDVDLVHLYSYLILVIIGSSLGVCRICYKFRFSVFKNGTEPTLNSENQKLGFRSSFFKKLTRRVFFTFLNTFLVSQSSFL